MRRRAVQLAVVAVTVALLLIGLPASILGSAMIWEAQQSNLDTRTQTLARAVERRLSQGDRVDGAMLDPWIDGRVNHSARIIVIMPEGGRVETPPVGEGKVLRSTRATGTIDGGVGATVIMEVLVRDVQAQIARMILFLGAASAVAFTVAVLVALRGSRRIAAPLIYLAAAAEQLGSGHARPNVRPSGIEEIDLVQDELVRTAERMAGRLAAERQFARDASHQLRTPLTSLSMRLEEIQFLSDNEEVKEEAELSLQQIERLTGVVDDLLRTSRKAEGGTTEALRLSDIFEQQEEEWQETFKAAGRALEVSDEAERIALASPGALAQVLATLIENSLKYGEGTTTISTRPATGRGVFIDVADEGGGVSDELAPDIFSKGISGHGSSGLGLALAKDLVTADGGRLELTQRQPPIFTIFLNELPGELDPALVIPKGALVTVGRRRRRR
ncbi:MAG TPA: HAMP domain-containing histidine kinase [Actinomycetales bacterium]|nr:HAMP domain-containing histidine kinase [Actinomycetales bacterium]